MSRTGSPGTPSRAVDIATAGSTPGRERHHPPAAADQRRCEPGEHEGGLAAARGSGQHQQRVPLQPRQALGDLGRAPEERVLVRWRRTTTGPSRDTRRWAPAGPARRRGKGPGTGSTARARPGRSRGPARARCPASGARSGSNASASACRPPLYWASARISHRRSRNGSSPAATVAPAATPRWSPVSRRAWSRSSTTASRSSFSRMASSRPASHSSSSVNGRPCHMPRACSKRAAARSGASDPAYSRPRATSASNSSRSTSTASGRIR